MMQRNPDIAVANGLISAINDSLLEQPAATPEAASPSPATESAPPAKTPAAAAPAPRRKPIDDTPVQKAAEAPAVEYLDVDDLEDEGESAAAGDATTTPAVAAEKKPEPKAVEPPAADEFGPDLLARAKEHGFSEAEMRGLGTPATAEKVFNHLDIQFARQQRAAQKKPAETTETDETKPAFDREKALEKWDPEIVDMMEQNHKLRDGFAALQQEKIDRQHEETRVAIDGFFNGLETDDAALFGEGEGRRVKAESPKLFENRTKVLEKARILAGLYHQSGERVSDLDILTEAKELVKLKLNPPAAPAKPAEKPKPSAASQTVARGSPRPSKAASGDEAALADIRRITGAQGVQDTAIDREVHDSLL